MVSGETIYKITLREEINPNIAFCYEMDLIDIIKTYSHSVEKIEPYATVWRKRHD